jgi:glutamate/tyrosine decarboxylase-like PLP-dependent enzyme
MVSDILAQFNELAESLLKLEKETPALSYRSPEQFHRLIDLKINSEGFDEKDLVQILKTIAKNTTKTSGHRFFNQLFGGRIDIAVVADMLASLLNISMYTYKVAGVHVLLEQEIVNKMCSFIGFSEGEGIFTPGGSLSNMIAMIMARNEADHSIKQTGIPVNKFIAYTSCQSHYSVTKNAGIVGIGRQNVRQITVDYSGKMRLAELEETIQSDMVAGFKPFFINATTGTTVLGAFDDVEKIADIAEKYGIWLHVDGAWGGSMILNEKYQHLFKGAERADSFTWDAHKMMGVPLIASTILTREKGMLKKHFSEPADYLFQADDDFLNPGTRSIQCGRRNDVLKVWAAWKCLGDQGYAARIDKLRANALYLAKKIDEDNELQLLCQPESLNICFDVPEKSSQQICDYLDRNGIIKVGYGVFKNKSFIRAICVNPEMTEEDLDFFVEQIKAAAAKIID